MKPTLLTATALILTLTAAFAVDEAAKKEQEPFDITVIQKRIEEAGIPTPAVVQQLEAKANALAKEGKWQEAADTYDMLAKSADWLANLIYAGIEPFYEASYDDRKNYPIKDSDLKLENQSNYYKTKRNEAMIYQAECYVRLNDTKRAIPLLVRGLELIHLTEMELWARARKDLYLLIQVTE